MIWVNSIVIVMKRDNLIKMKEIILFLICKCHLNTVWPRKKTILTQFLKQSYRKTLMVIPFFLFFFFFLSKGGHLWLYLLQETAGKGVLVTSVKRLLVKIVSPTSKNKGVWTKFCSWQNRDSVAFIDKIEEHQMLETDEKCPNSAR